MVASSRERREFLEQIELFSAFGPAEIDQIVEFSTTRSISANEILCHKGDEAGQLYGVLAGRLKAVGTGADGRETVFAVIGPGEVTGEIALIDGQSRSATLAAMEDSDLLIIGRREFLAFLRRDTDAAIQMCQILARYVRRLSDSVEDAYYQKLPARLAKKLLMLAREHGQAHSEGRLIGVKLSQSELGELIGKTREAVNKQLRDWTDGGLVTLVDGHILLCDPERLEDIADGDSE